jgi:hypothetical protein
LHGLRLKEYAAHTGLSVDTIKTHLQHVFEKTGYRRQADLVRALASDPIVRMAVQSSVHFSKTAGSAASAIATPEMGPTACQRSSILTP